MNYLRAFTIGISINAISWVYIIEKNGLTRGMHLSFFIVLPLIFGLSLMLLFYFLEKIEKLQGLEFLIKKRTFVDRSLAVLAFLMNFLVIYIFWISSIQYPLEVKILLIVSIIISFLLAFLKDTNSNKTKDV